MKEKRNYTLEFWRFIFSILICLFHFEKMYRGSEATHAYFATGFISVEFFFILAGFFIAQAREQRMDPFTIETAARQGLSFVKKKFEKIFFRFALVTFLLIIFVYGTSITDIAKRIMNLEWDLLFLQNTSLGRGDSPIGVMWFVSSLVITGYFTVVALYWQKNATKYLLAPIAWLLGYSYFGFQASSLATNMQQFGILSSGTIRGFAGLGLGISTFYLYQHIIRKEVTKKSKILFNIIEWYVLFRIFFLIFEQPANKESFRLLFYFPVLIILSYSKITLLSKILDTKFSKYLGKISLVIFLIHPGVIRLYIRYSPEVNRFKVDLLVYLCIVVLLAVLTELGFSYLPPIVRAKCKSIRQHRKNKT